MAKKSKLTKHHVPPKKSDPRPRFLEKKGRKHHEAYALLFGRATSFEEAALILKALWWTPSDENNELVSGMFILRKEVKYHVAYHCLFQNAKSFEDAKAILKHDWWMPEETRKK